jgi:hypothetical protein
MLAGELVLAGIDVAIVERRSTSDELIGSRGRDDIAHDRGSRPAWHR